MRLDDRPRRRSLEDFGRILSAPARDDEPTSFEQVTRRGLEDLTRQVDRIERDLNGLLFGVAGSLLIELYRTIVH
ncbi:MAG TPA: hypothetical protein VKT80_01865 [Chloroflexota bacterium]|nr:hypothetical protein [Chloroflexota bacterium]